MKARVFFDTNPAHNCVRVEIPVAEGVFAELPATAADVRFVDFSLLPSDRTFRNAWKSDLTVDMPKARNIQRDTLRRLRQPILERLDAEYLRAHETGNVIRMQVIAARKQELRDVTIHPSIEAALTPPELKVAATDVISKANP